MPAARIHHALFAVLCLCQTAALADELTLRDGSRILGSVVKKEDNTLQFKTSFAGVIKVQWDQVGELKTDQPTKVMLSDDEIIETKHIRNSENSTSIETAPDAPPREFTPSQVAFIKPDAWRLGKGHKFSGRVNFALETQRGNTDKDEIDVDLDLLWRRRNDRFTLFGELENDHNDGKKTTDKWNISSKYNYFVTKKRYYGGTFGMEADDLADLTLRVLGGPLAGYQFYESKALNLATELGIMRVFEDFQTQDNDRYWGAGWHVNFDRFVFNDMMQVYHRQNGLWNLYDTSDVIWDTWTGLRFPLVLGLVVSTEVKVEYDSGAAKDADEVDTTYQLKLGYQW